MCLWLLGLSPDFHCKSVIDHIILWWGKYFNRQGKYVEKLYRHMPQLPFNTVMGNVLGIFCIFVSLYSIILQSYLKKLVTDTFIGLYLCLFHLCVSLEMLLLLLDLETVYSCRWILTFQRNLLPLSSELKS